MLFKRHFLDGIRIGTVTVAFRRWQRPTVRAGGTLLTPAGELRIGAVTRVALHQISEADVRHAGYQSRDALLRALKGRTEGSSYRIELAGLGPDPRDALRDARVTREDDRRALLARLERLDSRDSRGPWTRRVLELIGSRPGVRAKDLCRLVGQDLHCALFTSGVRSFARPSATLQVRANARALPPAMFGDDVDGRRGIRLAQGLERSRSPRRVFSPGRYGGREHRWRHMNRNNRRLI
jgi:hypothetical protein